MSEHAYSVMYPAHHVSCVVFASPHSGRDYPTTFLRHSVLNAHAIRTSEDAYVDQLFNAAPDYGAVFLKARAPRAYVDLNRARTELDPALIEGATNHGHNPRVASGLGVIPRVVANGRSIYRGKISMVEAQRRLDEVWTPYHNQLQKLLETATDRFGQAVLVDCHSMPHEAMDGIAKSARRRPDVVLGDRFGAAASSDIVDRIEAAFASAGFTVTRNAPFAGAHITQAYGRPNRNQHAVQVEIDRSIYMNERAIRPNSQFERVRLRLRNVMAEIAKIGQDRLPLAAE